MWRFVLPMWLRIEQRQRFAALLAADEIEVERMMKSGLRR